MKPIKFLFPSAAILFGMLSVQAQTIVKTSTYEWSGDTIVQGQYKAYAPDCHKIVSTYHAQPHFFMPIEPEWQLRNDISSYPQLTTDNTLHTAIYNMALDEMVNAVEPDTTLRTGREWAGVWTRDVSYSIILSMAYMQPEASKISLMKKVNKNGRIIQDTGSGGAWPVSSDRMVWAIAAYEIYKVTGERNWLEYIYPIIKNSFEDDFKTVYSECGLVKGETSFIDWREQSYPKWMQTVDIYQSEALGTSCIHAAGLKILSDIASQLGKKKEAQQYAVKAEELKNGINKHLWLDSRGYYAMYRYGRLFPIRNLRAETLGLSLAVIYGIAPAERAEKITESNPTTPFGAAIFFPQIKDMPSYHNNALWPFVASFWAIANARVGNEDGTLQAIGSVFRPAALFATNKENFNLDNGDIATELNSSNMLWCLSGNLALTHRILFGLQFETDGLYFRPFVPRTLNDKRTLSGFKYRNATLNIMIEGFGDEIKSFKLNGKETNPFISPKLKGENEVTITLSGSFKKKLKVNNSPNIKAPLTPIAYIEKDLNRNAVKQRTFLKWNPIEYIDFYIVVRNGIRIGTTRQTRFEVEAPGEYQVIGVDGSGVESFASEPQCYYPTFVFQTPAEMRSLHSKEISYKPKHPISGYDGDGYTEIDHTPRPIKFDIDVANEGKYTISLRYANGNGPVNTENKCAIRTIFVDGKRLGVVVMPQRGVANWNDWGLTNTLPLDLEAGSHTVTIEWRDENENMNLDTNHALIDCLILTRLE